MFFADWNRPSTVFGSQFADLDKFFQEFGLLAKSALQADVPVVDLWQSDDAVFVRAELPGVKSESIDLSVIRDRLTLSGTRDELELAEGEKFYQQERPFGEFKRIVKLPFEVNVDNVEASFKDGILEIHLPRADKVELRKIAIKTS